MTHYFFDSSALAKRYINEIGSAWVQSLFQQNSNNTIIVAQITQVEIISSVMRRKREGAVSVRTAQAIRLLLGRHIDRAYTVIGLTQQVLVRAESLLDVHPLRAYDSVQLASALESNLRLVNAGLHPLVFVSGDTRLLNVAIAEGLPINNPNNHP